MSAKTPRTGRRAFIPQARFYGWLAVTVTAALTIACGESTTVTSYGIIR